MRWRKTDRSYKVFRLSSKYLNFASVEFAAYARRRAYSCNVLLQMPCNTADAVKSPLPKAGLTGGDLAKELLAIRRNLPIILCTGFSEIITKEKAKAIGIREFIMKPIVVQEVGAAIRRVLDQSTDD